MKTPRAKRGRKLPDVYWANDGPRINIVFPDGREIVREGDAAAILITLISDNGIAFGHGFDHDVAGWSWRRPYRLPGVISTLARLARRFPSDDVVARKEIRPTYYYGQSMDALAKPRVRH